MPMKDNQSRTDHSTAAIIDRADLQSLFDALEAFDYQNIGPTVRDGAIVYEPVRTVADLPIGWTDEQGPGTYRLVRRDDQAVFGFTVGPQAWKRYLHPPLVRLWHAKRDGTAVTFHQEKEESPRWAFIGVRSCELNAIAIQDRTFLEGPYRDPTYAARREGLFIVAVNCGQAGGTCFCHSMGTGPRARRGFDLALTEVLKEDQHYFLVEVGSERGAAVLDVVPHRPAGIAEQDAAEAVVANAVARMGRAMRTDGIKELLYGNYDHPRWNEVAERCLSCGNCTMVCPTCFCTTVEDVTDLTGDQAEHRRVWDSCFTTDFSYIHGGSVRKSVKSRYRQWMTHKLATWYDQFDTSGCVGCGRCIAWCPVGIDITEEVGAIRASVLDAASQVGAGRATLKIPPEELEADT